MTTSQGVPVDDNQNSMTAGQYGPVLIQDHHLIDKLAKFDRERIPERVAHAKGTGAHGVFVVTNDVTKYCKAKLFEVVGKQTPIFARFSTTIGEQGSGDTERDPRGNLSCIKVWASSSTPKKATGTLLATQLLSFGSKTL